MHVKCFSMRYVAGVVIILNEMSFNEKKTVKLLSSLPIYLFKKTIICWGIFKSLFFCTAVVNTTKYFSVCNVKIIGETKRSRSRISLKFFTHHTRFRNHQSANTLTNKTNHKQYNVSASSMALAHPRIFCNK